MDVAESICQWILKLPREETASGSCLSYTAVSQNSVHNSNLLGAGMLASTWKHRPTPAYLETARESIIYSCSRQRFDGSWWYGEEQKHHWVDNFHTGYNLDSLKRYSAITCDERFRQNLIRGYNYFKQTFFESSGRPRYYNTSTYPVDIQCAAQAIDTFCIFARDDEEALPMAKKVARWTIDNMQAADGHFFYREYPLLKAHTPYFHWGQATMFKALSHLLWSQSSANQAVQEMESAEPEAEPSPAQLSLALITPAKNEEAFIEQCIQAVISQTVRPVKWVIVSDGSTDRTDEIVREYAKANPWIELHRMPARTERQFAAKANAFNAGYARIATTAFDVIGNLDADITFNPEYLAFLLGKLANDPQLGVAGTPFVEDRPQPGGHTYAHRFAQLEHVSGACQLFRRACFESVGGFKPVKGGAIDWIAVTTARMNGWKTRTFTEKVCQHHRTMGSASRGPLAARFHHGVKEYYVGGHPAWQVLRSLFQMRSRPFVLGGLSLLGGYIWAWARRVESPVSSELRAFHRKEQMDRLWKVLSRHRQSSSSAA